MSNKSKHLALVLRHDPGSIGIKLDKEGWTNIPTLLEKLSWSMEDLTNIVAEDSKGRYSIEGDKVRANQGHSTSEVKINFKKAIPPTVLYHGTVEKFREPILKQGLIPGSRHHVHLSDNMETATSVGGRRKGQTIIFSVDAKAMLAQGYEFYLSENGVWLMDAVPAKFLSLVLDV